MPIETDYEPRYVDLDDVPIEGPDDWSDGEKRRAVYEAEVEIEADVNKGQEIGPDDFTRVHERAVLNLATCYLTYSAEDPSEVTLGDMRTGPGAIADYSEGYCEKYDDLVDKIHDEGIGQSSRSAMSRAVNSSADQGVHDPNDRYD